MRACQSRWTLLLLLTVGAVVSTSTGCQSMSSWRPGAGMSRVPGFGWMSSKPKPTSEALASSSPAPPASSATPTGAANPALASGGTAPAYAPNSGPVGGNAYPPNAYANQAGNAPAGYQTGQYNTGGMPAGGANPQAQPAAAQNGFYAATPNGGAPNAGQVPSNGSQFGAAPVGYNNPPAGQFVQQPAGAPGYQANGFQAQPPVNDGNQMAAAPQGYPQTPHSPIASGPTAHTAMVNQPNAGYQAPPSNFEVQEPAAGGASRFSEGGAANATYDAMPTQPSTSAPTSTYQNSQPTQTPPYRPGTTSSYEGSSNSGSTFRS